MFLSSLLLPPSLVNSSWAAEDRHRQPASMVSTVRRATDQAWCSDPNDDCVWRVASSDDRRQVCFPHFSFSAFQFSLRSWCLRSGEQQSVWRRRPSSPAKQLHLRPTGVGWTSLVDQLRAWADRSNWLQLYLEAWILRNYLWEFVSG
nr:hypothetical protein Iba_chr07dCG5610 [Ipomoea batatas]